MLEGNRKIFFIIGYPLPLAILREKRDTHTGVQAVNSPSNIHRVVTINSSYS
jgi:hypothetical protein